MWCPLQVETEGLRRSIQNLGVLITTAAVAHTSVATGEGLRHAATGQHHTITVTTKDKDGELVRTGNAVLKAEIVSADGSRAAETEIADNKNGTYEVGYTLRSEGEYSFSLLLYGQPIRGSPFRLRAVKPSDVPQSPDDVKRRVKSPSGTGGHIRQKAVRRPSSMYSTTKKKENPIEDELIYRVGKKDDPSRKETVQTNIIAGKMFSIKTAYFFCIFFIPLTTNQEYLSHTPSF